MLYYKTMEDFYYLGGDFNMKEVFAENEKIRLMVCQQGDTKFHNHDFLEMVYITETGTVYHTSRQCTHLRLSIKLVPFEQIPKLRNNSGGKYKKCQICASNSRPGNSVYITTNGDRYHINGNCSGLKRTIKEVPLSQVKGRALCERCKK